MNRLFNKRQRLLLMFRQAGRCACCGDRLTQGFHADHVQPFSKGGKTVIQNGQALCPFCNLKKGAA
ncbi:MAG: HNH endonuclease [Planctomycetaceae bacterium]|nr:HNH endonuclease [Planctomycetaceae bacterium]